MHWLLKCLLLVLAVIAGLVLWQRSILQVMALSRVDPVPETQLLVEEKRYADAAEYLEFFMQYDYVKDDPAAQTLFQEIETVRSSAAYQAEKLKEGLIDGTSDESIGQATGVITDFFVIGDVRDLTHQAINWSQNEEVDEVVATLSGIGLIATAAQVVTVGGATPVKGGVTLLKTAKKLGKLPAWLGQAILDGAKAVKQTKKLDAVSDLLTDVWRVSKHAGMRNGMELLSHTKDAGSLKRMATMAEAVGKDSGMLFKIGGEAAVKVGQKAAEIGVDTVKLSATFGAAGIRALDQVGAIKFVKYASRSGKVLFKGEWVSLVARLLMMLPEWILFLLVSAGGVVWIPWRWIKKPSPFTAARLHVALTK